MIIEFYKKKSPTVAIRKSHLTHGFPSNAIFSKFIWKQIKRINNDMFENMNLL